MRPWRSAVERFFLKYPYLMPMPRNDETILILGASGWIGYNFTHQVCSTMPLARVIGTYFEHTTRQLPCQSLFFDYTVAAALSSLLQSVRPSVVVNLLGGEEAGLFRTHQELTRKLKELSVYYIFMSSSMVFDADVSKPHQETDPIQGKSSYGIHKEQCERFLHDEGENYCIMRISATHGYSPNKISRTERFLQNMQLGKSVHVDEKIFQNRLGVADLVSMIIQVMDARLQGVIHLGTIDQSEEVDFLRKIAKHYGYNPHKVEPVKSTPKYLTMIPKTIYEVFGEHLARTEADTLEYIAKIPEFQKYKKATRKSGGGDC